MIILEFKLKGTSRQYKTTGWKLDELRRQLTLTDGLGLGTFKL